MQVNIEIPFRSLLEAVLQIIEQEENDTRFTENYVIDLHKLETYAKAVLEYQS